jgi:hypothetical protein
MMMRYHHFIGIGHTYSSVFRPTHASPCSPSAQDIIEVHSDEDQDMVDLPPAIQVGESADLSDTDSVNTIDNGWQGWDDEFEDEDKDEEGHESDGELVDMDSMYRR